MVTDIPCELNSARNVSKYPCIYFIWIKHTKKLKRSDQILHVKHVLWHCSWTCMELQLSHKQMMWQLFGLCSWPENVALQHDWGWEGQKHCHQKGLYQPLCQYLSTLLSEIFQHYSLIHPAIKWKCKTLLMWKHNFNSYCSKMF